MCVCKRERERKREREQNGGRRRETPPSAPVLQPSEKTALTMDNYPTCFTPHKDRRGVTNQKQALSTPFFILSFSTAHWHTHTDRQIDRQTHTRLLDPLLYLSHTHTQASRWPAEFVVMATHPSCSLLFLRCVLLQDFSLSLSLSLSPAPTLLFFLSPFLLLCYTLNIVSEKLRRVR